jgi:hypothetical protein
MEQTTPVKPQTLETLLTSLKADYARLMVLHNSSWRTPEDREEARLALMKSMKTAKRAVQELEGTQDTELRHLYGQLLIESTLAEDACKHPETLKR